MNSKKLRLRVISPSKTKYDGDVDMVVMPGSEGDLGVLPNHAPMIVELKAGEVKIYKNNSVETSISIEGSPSGVASISAEGVDIILV
jgi:F-type H+-transporting ATPase subunit epsilon